MNNQRGATLRSLTVRTIRRIRLNRQGCRGGAMSLEPSMIPINMIKDSKYYHME